MMDSAESESSIETIEDQVFQTTTEPDKLPQNQNALNVNSNTTDRVTETVTPASSLMDSKVLQENVYFQQAISTSVLAIACNSDLVQNLQLPHVLASPAKIDNCDSTSSSVMQQNVQFQTSLNSGIVSSPQYMETAGYHEPESKEELDTNEVLQRVVRELKKQNISVSVFAERVLNCPRNTLSKFMRHPKPWPKLTLLRKKLLQKMWRWLQEPELKHLSAVFPNSNQDDKPCFVCKIVCNEAYKTGYPVSVEDCSQYGISESLLPYGLICVTCHSKQLRDNQNSEPVCTVRKYSEPVGGRDKHNEPVCSNAEHIEPVCSNAENIEPVCNNDKHNEPVYNNDEYSKPVCSDDGHNDPVYNEHSEPVCRNDEHSEPDCSTNEHSEPVFSNDRNSKPVSSTDEHCEPVFKKTNCSELVSSDLEKSESVLNEKLYETTLGGKETKSRCSSVLCSKDRAKHKGKWILSKLSSSFHNLKPDVKKLVMSKCGIIDENKKVCMACRNRVERMCLTVNKSKRKEASNRINRSVVDSEEHPSCLDEQSCAKSTEKYACGWCKFKATCSLTVVRHHYIKHQTQELDVVRLKTSLPSYKSRSCVNFSCESCAYRGRLRHQLHLHNDRFHEHTQNRGGVTDCESESDCSIVYPYFKFDTKLPNTLAQTRKKYKLKDVKIPCQDIFKSGLEYLMKSINDQGVSKLCVDSLEEDEFVSMATMYREDVSYCDSRVESYVPVSLEKLANGDIESLVRN